MAAAQPQFQDVYRQFHERIRRYLKRLAGENEADDLTQEVFVKISRNLDGFRGKSKLSTWVYRIATNAAMDRLRSASFRRGRETASLDVSDDESRGGSGTADAMAPSAERQVIKGEMDECIRQFIHDLPESYRTVLLLGELRGLKNREIADALGVSLHTVKIRLHRARVRLKAHLEQGCDLYHDQDSELACDRKAPEV